MQDTIDFAHENNKDWVVIFLDFQKAFDSVLHVFLWSLMSRMGFPQNYIQWTILLYAQAQSRIRNCGWMSLGFTLGRGVYQGCPLLCHLFNIISQVTVYYLKACGHFLWWTFTGDPNSLYADDIAIIAESIY